HRRKEKRVVSGLQRGGHAKYHRDKGLKAMKNNESIAKVMDYKANQYESTGKYIRAQTMKTAASKTRNTGEKIKNEENQYSTQLERISKESKQKVTDYATKKKIDLGKEHVNRILRESKNKGYDEAARNDERQKIENVRAVLGAIQSLAG
ncbi:MAG: hypothetical protein RSA92_01435, partial [Bacteroidaceae bacterium]